jgi:hypothetical protein
VRQEPTAYFLAATGLKDGKLARSWPYRPSATMPVGIRTSMCSWRTGCFARTAYFTSCPKSTSIPWPSCSGPTSEDAQKGRADRRRTWEEQRIYFPPVGWGTKSRILRCIERAGGISHFRRMRTCAVFQAKTGWSRYAGGGGQEFEVDGWPDCQLLALATKSGGFAKPPKNWQTRKKRFLITHHHLSPHPQKLAKHKKRFLITCCPLYDFF